MITIATFPGLPSSSFAETILNMPSHSTFPSNANHAGLSPQQSRLHPVSATCPRNVVEAQVTLPLAKCLAEGGYDVNVHAPRSPGSVTAVPALSTDVSATRAGTVAEVTKAQDAVVILHSHGVVISHEVLEGVEVGGRWHVIVISAGGGLVFIAGVVLPVGVCCCFARGNGWRVYDGSRSWVTMLELSMHGNFWETKLCPRHRTFLRQAYASSLPLQQAHHGCGGPLSPLQQFFPNPNLKPPKLLKLLCLTQSYN